MITWKVTRVETSSAGGLNDVIVRCTFDVLASDGAKHGYAFGEVDLLPPDAAEPKPPQVATSATASICRPATMQPLRRSRPGRGAR